MEVEDREKTPLWIDCDPGHDDAFALLLAAHHPHLHLLGVSTVHGNAAVEATTANAISVLTAVGRPDIPVYMGAADPLHIERRGAEEFHGSTGLAGTTLLPKCSHLDANMNVTAVEAIRDTLAAHPQGSTWLLAIGPLTNVARLLMQYPEAASQLGGLCIMGGALGDGYTTARLGKNGDAGELVNYPNRWAEFNIWCDPYAASVVLRNPVLTPKTTLVTLDLSHQVLADQQAQSLLFPHVTESSPPVRRLFFELLKHSESTYQTYFPTLPGPPLHDPIAAALVLAAFGEEGDGERWGIKIVTEGEQRGRTMRTPASSNEGIWIPRQINQNGLWDTLAKSLSLAEKAADRTGAFDSPP